MSVRKQIHQMEDIASLIVIRIFAKRQKGEINDGDFNTLASFGAAQALGIITVGSKRQLLQEIVDGELRRACELISAVGCGKCKQRGIRDRRGARYIICECVDMVHYRGDRVLPLGEQYSNQYFEGDFSKQVLGQTDTVRNVATAVMLFLIPKG